MIALSLPFRVLALLSVAVTVSANPVDVSSLAVSSATDPLATPEGITPCSTVRCASGTTCEVVDGRAKCVSIKGRECGLNICALGLTCCNASCGRCTKPGMMCTQEVCPPDDRPKETPCGPTVCKAGLECCNSSCGYCVAPGKGCTKELCLPPGPKCGTSRCQEGHVCCNSSCGICTPPGGACTQQFCGI